MKFLTHDGTLYFWKKIKSYVDTKTSTHIQTVATGGTGATNASDAIINLGAKAAEPTIFQLSDGYVGVRTIGRTASQYYEFWDSSIGWADIQAGKITAQSGFVGNLTGNASSASSVPWTGVSGKPSSYAASTITAGTFAGQVVAPVGTDYTTNRIRNIQFTTTDPGAGVSSSLVNGSIIAVYE